jgi:hypothetical protein
MAKNFNNRALAVSQKIYGRLLLAYPKAHREEYGPAMAQLFRDQGRDAWNESQSWGVVKLWLRVLPDLVKTSITERLAALNTKQNTKKQMKNTIITSMKNKIVIILSVAGLSALLITHFGMQMELSGHSYHVIGNLFFGGFAFAFLATVLAAKSLTECWRSGGSVRRLVWCSVILAGFAWMLVYGA